MGRDASRRQGQIGFGGRGTLTTDIEADEAQFFHWSETDAEGSVSHVLYIWVGVVGRGDSSKV